MDFRVELDTYRGPLELLLYLVRKHELEVVDIPIAIIADQFTHHLSDVDDLDVNAVGDFLEVASTLVEIKSRAILPRMDDDDEPLEDPREGLVRQLLEYKKYKDVASILEERGRLHQQSYPRLANDLPQRRTDPSEQPICDLELWDLVSAMGRITRNHDVPQESTIVYDETPIQVYMEQIHQRVQSQGQVGISEIFEVGMHKSAVIGIFLAVLELMRHQHVVAEQGEGYGEIVVTPGPCFERQVDVATMDAHDPSSADAPSSP